MNSGSEGINCLSINLKQFIQKNKRFVLLHVANLKAIFSIHCLFHFCNWIILVHFTIIFTSSFFPYGLSKKKKNPKT